MLYLVFLVIAFIVWLELTSGKRGRRDCFRSKPTSAEKKTYLNQIIKNQEYFTHDTSLDRARKLMPWIDAVTFEDVRRLKRSNLLTHQELNKII